MKVKATAVIIALLLFCTVNANSMMLTRGIDKICAELDNTPNTPDSEAEYMQIYGRFDKYEKFISLTVSHDELGNIRDCFAELLGACRAKSEADIITAKSRLVEMLIYLRRLCSVSLDSIF